MNAHDSAAVQRLLEQLNLPLFPQRLPRYNITPRAELDVLFDRDQFALMEWGIEFGKFRHPNTKTETVKHKEYLQKLLLKNRCIVPVNRFYEWPDPKVRPKYQGVKTRFCIHTPDDVMFLGGLYKINSEGVMQFNVLTTDPTLAISDFHHRMPVLIKPERVKEWLHTPELQTLYDMMVPYEGELIIYACDAYVDNGRHEGPRCMEEEQR